MRPAMTAVFCGIKGGYRYRSAARSGNLIDPRIFIGAEKYCLSGVPGPTSTRRRIAYDLNSAAGRRNRFQFSIRKEPDGFSIRGPERTRCFIRAIQAPGHCIADLPDPQEILLISANKRDGIPVRRNGY